MSHMSPQSSTAKGQSSAPWTTAPPTVLGRWTAYGSAVPHLARSSLFRDDRSQERQAPRPACAGCALLLSQACALRYTHRRRRSIMIPGSRDGHSGFCRNAPCTPAGRGGRERRSRWAVKADALQPWPTPSRGWRGPQAEQAEDSGLLKALPPVTWTTGGGQNGRCPYRHAPLVGPKGQQPPWL